MLVAQLLLGCTDEAQAALAALQEIQEISGKEVLQITSHMLFKLLAALGAWMGWKMLLPIILLSSVVGAMVGVVLIVLARRGREIPIPFGPYLAAAGFIAMLYGNDLSHRILGF